jgi:endo-1,4-beta-xylanase
MKPFLALVLLSMATLPGFSADATLKAAYGRWFDLGAAIPGGNLNKPERDLLCANFTTVTPENCMKPQETEPQEGRFTFGYADQLVSFAQENGLKVNGHTLVWHSSCPDWFFQDAGKTYSDHFDSNLISRPLRYCSLQGND